MGYQEIKKWRHETKKRLIESFGGKCGICGYNKSIRAMSLHHLDLNTKEKNFRAKCQSWEKIVIEARKCVLLCSNCHMEIHDGIIKVPNDIRRFDERYATYKTDEKLMNECLVCGKMKPIKQITCSINCASKRKYVVDWDKIDVIKMYEDLGSYSAIATKIGISDATVRKRIKKLKS